VGVFWSLDRVWSKGTWLIILNDSSYKSITGVGGGELLTLVGVSSSVHGCECTSSYKEDIWLPDDRLDYLSNGILGRAISNLRDRKPSRHFVNSVRNCANFSMNVINFCIHVKWKALNPEDSWKSLDYFAGCTQTANINLKLPVKSYLKSFLVVVYEAI